MDTTTTNDTEIIEMLQTLMDEGMQGFLAVAARMYNLAMQFARELHVGAGRYERTEERTGCANGYKTKTLKSAAGHLQQNAKAYVTKSSLKAEVAQDVRPVFNARSPDEARLILADIVEKYARTQSRLSAWMEDDIPEGLTVFAFPATIRQFLRTSNMEKNLNRRIRQRTRLIPAFPNGDSLPGLVSAICVEISDAWETNRYRYMSAIKEL